MIPLFFLLNPTYIGLEKKLYQLWTFPIIYPASMQNHDGKFFFIISYTEKAIFFLEIWKRDTQIHTFVIYL
jgi:hypothetical protein